jgi:pre-rRNA-processing protein TSR2
VKTQAKLELGVALALLDWPALSLAVENNWGAGDGLDKRDWFGGAIVDLFATRPDTDLNDVEIVLLQVMLDEFEVNVDDETAFDVAEKIMDVRKSTSIGDWTVVDKMQEDFQARGERGVKGSYKRVEKAEDDDDTDWDSADDEEDDDEDVQMVDAESQSSPQSKKKVEPEIDDDGFTKVAKKSRKRQ